MVTICIDMTSYSHAIACGVVCFAVHDWRFRHVIACRSIALGYDLANVCCGKASLPSVRYNLYFVQRSGVRFIVRLILRRLFVLWSPSLCF